MTVTRKFKRKRRSDDDKCTHLPTISVGRSSDRLTSQSIKTFSAVNVDSSEAPYGTPLKDSREASIFIMYEQGSITELQMLEQEIAVLQRMKKGCESAPNTGGTVTVSIIQNIQKTPDSFLMGTESSQNQYHTSAPGAAAADGGCCIVL